MKKLTMQRDIRKLRRALKGIVSVGDDSSDRPRLRAVAVETLRRTDRYEHPTSGDIGVAAPRATGDN